MGEKLPVGRLSRLTLLQALTIGFIFYLLITHSRNPHGLVLTLLTMSGILLTGYADILIMIYLSKRMSIRSQRFSFYRRGFTYLSAQLIYQCLRPLFSYVGNEHWSFLNLQSLLIFAGSGIVINTLITLLHDSVLLYEHKLYAELEMSRLTSAHAEAMNLALKQQIQPHFLFNALNTLKALYHKDRSIADHYIVHLANFLRASIFHQSSHVAKLEDEVALLNDYLQMQQIRFGQALECRIDLNEETLQHTYLPSFSLQPLLENAIKHNTFTREHTLYVNIKQEGQWLVINNNLQKRKVKADSTNYGLANLAERYRLWSGDEIRIAETDQEFSVSIKLLTHEHNHH